VTLAGSNTLTSIVTLIATADDGQISFSNGASTFHALAAQADDGISVNKNVFTRTDYLHLDADYDNNSTGDTTNKLTFADNLRITARTTMTLESSTSTTTAIRPTGAITFTAGSGIVVFGDMQTQSTGVLTIHSDNDASGSDGTVTVQSGKTVETQNNDVMLTVWDLDLQGSLTAGTATTTVHQSTNDETIGIGGSNQDIHITDAELGRITSNGGLEIGTVNSASVTINGVTDSSSDSVGTLTIVATKTSRTVLFSSYASVFNKGIIVQASGGVILSQSVTTRAGATVVRAGTASLTILDRRTLSTTNQFLTVTADDIDIQGTGGVSTGTAGMVIATETAKSIGLGTTANDMDIEAEELQKVTAEGLTLGSNGINNGISVVGIALLDSQHITDVVTLIATIDNSQVVFQTTASTFYGLAAQADNGVLAQVQVQSTPGILHLDADVDNSSSADSANKVTLASGQTITAKTMLTLASAATSIDRAGSLTLTAGTGIYIFGDLKSETKSSALVMHADNDAANDDGTLTVVTGKTITSNDSDVVLTAWDLDLAGSLDAGTRGITIHGSKVGQTIGLGGSPSPAPQPSIANMWIADAELARASAHIGLTVGSSTNGDLRVYGTAAASVDAIGTLTLYATHAAGKNVAFTTAASSFNKGIVIESSNGIILSQSVTTMADPITMDTGTGKLTLDGSAQLSTTNEMLTITTDDVVLSASAAITTGTKTLVLKETTSARNIGIGATPSPGIAVSNTEFQKLTAVGMIVGTATSGDITVQDVDATESNTVTGLLTLTAYPESKKIVFTGTASTFNALVAQAGDAIEVDVDLHTDTGIMTLDGDADGLPDAADKIKFTNTRILTAVGMMTLDSTTGGIQRSGATSPMTLTSGSGIMISDDFVGASPGTAQALNINADSNGSGSGTFTVGAQAEISTTNGILTITAADIDIQSAGGLSSGTAITNIYPTNERTVGLGLNTQEMNIEATEVQRISSAGLTIGSTGSAVTQSNKGITVVGLDATVTGTILGTVTLVATIDNSQVVFQTTASTFHALEVQADSAILVNANAASSFGQLYLDADYDDSFTSDSPNTLYVAALRTISSNTLLTLESSAGTGTVYVVNIGELTLTAGSGIVIHDTMTGEANAKPLVVNSDLDANGSGTLTVETGKTIDSNNSDITITAWDLFLDGTASVTAGTRTMSIHGSDVGTTIALGVSASAKNMHIDNIELGQLSASNGFVLGGSAAGTIAVNGVQDAKSSNLQPVVTLAAKNALSQVLFEEAGSTFHALEVQADNGIIVEKNILTTDGAIYMDGDMENQAETGGSAHNKIGFTDGRTVTAATLLTLESSQGHSSLYIVNQGTLTLAAGTGIVIHDTMTGAANAKPLVVNSDLDANGSGTLTVSTGKTIDSNNSDITITAWDIDFSGGLKSGTATLCVHGAQSGQTIGLGASAKNMHITGSEVQRITTAGGLLLGSNQAGDITVDAVQTADSTHITGFLTLIALTDDSKVLFNNAPSSFTSLEVQADDGITISQDVTATSDIGSLLFDGDGENLGDTDTVALVDGITLTALTKLTLKSNNGDIIPAGAMSLSAATGVYIHDNIVSTAAANKILTINADNDSTGTNGALTVHSGATISSNDNIVRITAWDFDLDGTIDAGSNTARSFINIHGAETGQTIGIGTSTADMHVDATEFSKLTAKGLVIGSTTSSDLTLLAVNKAQSDDITGIVTLVAGRDGSKVTFDTGTPSTFHALEVQADNGVHMKTDVHITTGSIHLDGDMENQAETGGSAHNKIEFTD
jgi:hypothetical protein